jgi:hypothetical protein
MDTLSGIPRNTGTDISASLEILREVRVLPDTTSTIVPMFRNMGTEVKATRGQALYMSKFFTDLAFV